MGQVVQHIWGMLRGKKSSSHVVAETLGTQGKIEVLQGETENLVEKASDRSRQETWDDIGCLLSDRSLTKQPLFLEKMRERDAVLAGHVY